MVKKLRQSLGMQHLGRGKGRTLTEEAERHKNRGRFEERAVCVGWVEGGVCWVGLGGVN